jgi:hypothetical protein
MLRLLLPMLLLMNATTLFAAVDLVVPGTSDPYLAGMAAGSIATNSGEPRVDVAPAESPVEITGLRMSSGEAFTFSATGAVANDPTFRQVGPDGGAFTYVPGQPQNGIADIFAPYNALIGVFLDNDAPDLEVAPARLDFRSLGLDFQSIAPDLRQPFFIGDGLTSAGMIQQFVVPDGATRLFVGTMDSSDWSNNVGSFAVTVGTVAVIPEPTHLVLLVGVLLSSVGRWRYSATPMARN